MSRYDIYAIGNALVDVEYRVDAEELPGLGIDKGVMTLVDAERQEALMAALAEREVHRSAGGSAANTVIAVAQFGGSGFYSCRIGDDALGRIYAEDLATNGVATNAREHAESGDTGRCLVLVTPDADRTMQTYLGITGDLGPEAVAPHAIAAADWLYVEGYLATSPAARAAVERARQVAAEAGTRSAISLSDPNIVHHFGDELQAMIGPGIDFVFANEDEALGLSGAKGLGDAIEWLRRMAREFAITRGAQGAVVYDGSRLHEIPAPRVTPVDTVGAGDMFAGAFLHARARGCDHATAGAFASTAASRIITEYGPRFRPGVADEVAAELPLPQG